MSAPRAAGQAIDFAVCEAERIDAPGTIQSFGALVAVDRRSLRVSHMSRNAVRLIDPAGPLAIGMTARALTETLTPHPAIDWDAPGDQPSQATWIGGDDRTSLFLSRSRAHFLLEWRLEPAPAPEGGATCTGLATLMDDDANPFRLAQTLTERLRDRLRYDRVMIYRFAEDWSGDVIAEAAAEGLSPYLGLRFPATDIPSQARRLYQATRLREIPDTNAGVIPIDPPCLASSDRPLDLSTSLLRAISPYHLEYMNNMGVRATLVASLVVEARLWGLIVCHDRSPHLATAAERRDFGLAADRLAERIAAAGVARRDRSRARVASAVAAVERCLDGTEPLAAPLLETLASATRADGVALRVGDRVLAIGHAPPAPDLARLGDALSGAEPGSVGATDCLSAHPAGDGLALDGVCGAAAVTPRAAPIIQLMAFREERLRTETWGGDPRNAAAIDQATGRMSPRRSFATWCETVSGHAAPWEEDALEFLARLAESPALARAATRLADDIPRSLQRLAQAGSPSLSSPRAPGAGLVATADERGMIRHVEADDGFLQLFDLAIEGIAGTPLAALIERLGRVSPDATPAETELLAWSPTAGGRAVTVTRRGVCDSILDGRRARLERHAFVDVTAARRAARANAVALDTAIAAGREKSAFLASLTHELMTPLHAMIGFSDMLSEPDQIEVDSASVARFAKRIRGAGLHLASLIDRLLTQAQLEAGRRTLVESRVDLARLAAECVGWFDEGTDAGPSRLTLRAPPEPIELWADELALRQILINLIGPDPDRTGTGRVGQDREAAAVAIDVAVTLDPMGAPTLTVTRDGCDIDPALLHAVFLARGAGDAYARGHEKAGLGLSSTRDLVEAHGGSIRAVSHLDELARGTIKRRTELIITLPTSRLMAPVD